MSNENAALNVLDLAHCLNGGRVVFTDDNHFGAGSNIILPGRGKDMVMGGRRVDRGRRVTSIGPLSML